MISKAKDDESTMDGPSRVTVPGTYTKDLRVHREDRRTGRAVALLVQVLGPAEAE